MKKNKSVSTLQQNYLQLLFVFVAFTLMVLAAYFFIGRILRTRLFNGAEELLSSAEANVKAGLSEAETTLLNSYYIVQGMVEREASPQEILDYLTVTTGWMRQRDQGLFSFYGIYGYINGEFYDSMGLNPDSDYIPQTRPWYQAAVRSGNAVAYTTPYRDARTNNTIVSAVRNIDLKNGEIVGILAIDININWLMEYVGSLALATDGYGMLLTQNMTLMTYPESEFIGRQLQDLGGAYEGIARTLRNGGDVSARQIMDSDGGSVIVFFKRMFNNWYVGIVTPYYQFYRDLNTSAQILAVLGIVLSLLLCFILLRLSAAKMRSDEESRSKSSFLASMSHEIRTPMNAITGMAELLLRGDLSGEARGYAQDIKQAGNNLISIINDILDFSKIEAGRLEIIPIKYLLASLLNDTANIILMRLAEKPIRFFTNVDGNIPNTLIGDEIRLRQILLNLLSNAVKYSEKGHIGLSICMEKIQEKQVWLKITVTDTGKGIKLEDQARLFNEFVQVDIKRNRSIEGTGLGLAITKRLCLAMGGDISVESEYGRGSAFTVIIPQSIASEAPFAAVENPEQKKVLVYESRTVFDRSINWALTNLHVPHTMVSNPSDFAEALFREEWFFVFTGHGLYEKIKAKIEQPGAVFPGGKKPQVALMVERGAELYIPNAHFLHLPVQSLSIANILNGKVDSKGYAESSRVSGGVRFTLKQARILVVDDLPTNIRVAEGLLAPYHPMVDTCLTGLESIEMVRLRNYDIVFMDHMMPGMDGIEATAVIRTMEEDRFKTMPIIALTANAVLGMREMFIERGFNDFLAKPIDVSKLDEILDQWIPKEKKEWEKMGKAKADLHVPFPIIFGIDVQRGIAMTGGTAAGYRTVLTIFCKDIEERLPLLQNMPDAGALSGFVTQVHALKSASFSIGAQEISEKAARLETAGKTGDMVYIKENLGGFAEQLASLGKSIRAVLETVESNEILSKGSPAFPLLSIILSELSTALISQNTSEIDRILEELDKTSLDSQTKETLEEISDQVLLAEFDKAGEILDEFLDRISGEKKE